MIVNQEEHSSVLQVILETFLAHRGKVAPVLWEILILAQLGEQGRGG